MKLNYFFLLFFCTSFSRINAQRVSSEYDGLVHKADSFYKIKQYKKSAVAYSKAFKTIGGKGTMTDRYNAACSWALAGYPDSAFFNLIRITSSAQRYSNHSHITVDNDLISLHNDKRWKPLIDSVKVNKERSEAKINWQLVKLLDSIHSEDQTCRKQIDKVEAEFGRESKEMNELVRIMRQKDSTNLIVVSSILDNQGWLGPDIVGVKGNEAIFLVVQHADLQTQEKYLPLMREAVNDGRAKGNSLALLEDRVAIRNGHKQIYGSQIGRDRLTGTHYVMALEDPDGVDKRRAKVGLGTLAEYVSKWNIKWDVVQYKKDLPELEAKLKAGH